MKTDIPGVADHAAVVQSQQPTDLVALRAEVRRLASQRLSTSEISAALQLSLPQVREMLAATAQEAAELHAQAWKT